MSCVTGKFVYVCVLSVVVVRVCVCEILRMCARDHMCLVG